MTDIMRRDMAERGPEDRVVKNRRIIGIGHNSSSAFHSHCGPRTPIVELGMADAASRWTQGTKTNARGIKLATYRALVSLKQIKIDDAINSLLGPYADPILVLLHIKSEHQDIPQRTIAKSTLTFSSSMFCIFCRFFFLKV